MGNRRTLDVQGLLGMAGGGQGQMRNGVGGGGGWPGVAREGRGRARPDEKWGGGWGWMARGC